MNYRILGSLAALALWLSFAAAAPPSIRAGLAGNTADETSTFCHYLEQNGHFEGEYLQGLTIDECVNYFKMPGSEQARSFVVGLCGLDVVRADFGFTSQEECVGAFTH